MKLVKNYIYGAADKSNRAVWDHVYNGAWCPVWHKFTNWDEDNCAETNDHLANTLLRSVAE